MKWILEMKQMTYVILVFSKYISTILCLFCTRSLSENNEFTLINAQFIKQAVGGTVNFLIF